MSTSTDNTVPCEEELSLDDIVNIAEGGHQATSHGLHDEDADESEEPPLVSTKDVQHFMEQHMDIFSVQELDIISRVKGKCGRVSEKDCVRKTLKDFFV